jgi:DNA-binding MarR family transcriptional regulator
MLDYFPDQMAKHASKTMIYRLIEAGHLARHALAAPLAGYGLEPGDDALLLSLYDSGTGMTTKALGAENGLDSETLAPRLIRLEALDLIMPAAVGATLEPGFRLTDQGEAVCGELNEHWKRLENALIGELSDKKRKSLKSILKRFVKLLEME